MIEASLKKVDSLIRHSRRSKSGEEAKACLGIAEEILQSVSNSIRRERIVAAAGVVQERAQLLEKFRCLLAYGEAHGGLTPAGVRLLNLAKQAPARPEKSISSEGNRFFSFFTQNTQEISDLIEQL
jgi:hypothetical protein